MRLRGRLGRLEIEDRDGSSAGNAEDGGDSGDGELHVEEYAGMRYGNGKTRPEGLRFGV